MEEGDPLDEPGGWVGGREDGVEDRSEVEGVDRGCEGAGDDGGGVRKAGEVVFG